MWSHQGRAEDNLCVQPLPGRQALRLVGFCLLTASLLLGGTRGSGCTELWKTDHRLGGTVPAFTARPN